MPERPVHVYRLNVLYPPGSGEPGWVPEAWPQVLAAVKDRKRRNALRKRGFRWPRNHLYLSASGAYSRALMLTWLGASVEVQRSEEVTWWEDGSSVAEWWPELDAPELPDPPAEPDPLDVAARFLTGVLPAHDFTLSTVREAADGIFASGEGTLG
jgi:hypothetical protein